MTISNILLGMHAINNSWSSGSPAHQGITNQMLFQLAADGGSGVVRVPLDLSVVGPSGPPQWVIDSIGTILQQADALGLQVVLEPGQTPPDLRPAGTSASHAPDSDAGLVEMGQRFAALVEADRPPLHHTRTARVNPRLRGPSVKRVCGRVARSLLVSWRTVNCWSHDTLSKAALQ